MNRIVIHSYKTANTELLIQKGFITAFNWLQLVHPIVS